MGEGGGGRCLLHLGKWIHRWSNWSQSRRKNVLQYHHHYNQSCVNSNASEQFLAKEVQKVRNQKLWSFPTKAISPVLYLGPENKWDKYRTYGWIAIQDLLCFSWQSSDTKSYLCFQ